MAFGFQEIIALTLVAVVVGFALYRRWRGPGKSGSDCSGCDAKVTGTTDEKPINFYRRNP